jgi:murein L,D-transpeptidase YcbB/YkuD
MARLRTPGRLWLEPTWTRVALGGRRMRRGLRGVGLAALGLAALAAAGLAACHKESGQPSGTAAAPQAPPPPPPPPPPFTRDEAEAALQALAHAADQGFASTRFPTAGLSDRLASADPTVRETGQRRLRALVLDYARAEHGFYVPLGALPRAWNQRPPYDAKAELDAALRSGGVRSWLDGLAPQTPEYRALEAAYVAATGEGAAHSRPKVVATTLEVGQQDARTRALRERLALEDPALSDADPDDPVDQALIDALRAYQTRHDLDASGALDEDTVERLNAPVVNRAARLRVNLERLRWLPRPQPATRIDVNIASAEMDYLRDGEPATHMLAVSGKLGDETPIVSSAIDSIVLDPPWYVPNDIARREILPKGSAYMQSRHFVWRGGRLIQLAGPKAALGLVKFDFPNPYAVYLHDTPSKASFSLSRRTASHGCVRLQHAVELARTVASHEPGLSAERVDRILTSGKTVRLKLAEPIPVRLMYLTAVPKGDAIAYLPDVYGWDSQLLALLDRYSTPPRPR